MTTPDAQAKVAQLLAGWLAGGTIVVIDGDMTASAPAEVVAEGNRVLATAVFDEYAANFHWRRRELRAPDGTVVDELDEDLGEKVFGAIWTLEVPLELVA